VGAAKNARDRDDLKCYFSIMKEVAGYRVPTVGTQANLAFKFQANEDKHAWMSMP